MSQTKKSPKDHSTMQYPEPKADGLTQEQAIARCALDPATKATAIIKAFAPMPTEQLGSTELLTELMKIGRQAKEGDLGGIEAMLAIQTYSLDAIFQTMALRAKLNMGEYPKAADSYMRLALKAQNQCRATAESLALVKNPQPYIRQANIGAAVQVNNETSTRRRAQAREIQSQQNELLSGGSYEALDSRGKSEAIGAYPNLETLAEIDRRKK